MSNNENEIHIGSGNVFADLGLPTPKERLAKSQLAMAIQFVIDENNYTQSEAASRMGMSQPDVSNIVRGRLKNFTIDRLIMACLALGLNVEVDLRKRKPDEPAKFEIHNHLMAA